MNSYVDAALIFKTLSDPTRLEIVDMLSGGELCACKILERFNITQPTLSHHMKILCECGLITGRKAGKWTYYSLNSEISESLISFTSKLLSEKKVCNCIDTSCQNEECE